METQRPERKREHRKEPNWLVQALVTALINQLAPSALTVFTTFLVLIRAGIVDRNRLNLGIIAVALAVALAISLLAFVLGIRYTIRVLARWVVFLLFWRHELQQQNKHWWARLAAWVELALMGLAFLPEWLSEMRDEDPRRAGTDTKKKSS